MILFPELLSFFAACTKRHQSQTLPLRIWHQPQSRWLSPWPCCLLGLHISSYISDPGMLPCWTILVVVLGTSSPMCRSCSHPASKEYVWSSKFSKRHRAQYFFCLWKCEPGQADHIKDHRLIHSNVYKQEIMSQLEGVFIAPGKESFVEQCELLMAPRSVDLEPNRMCIFNLRKPSWSSGQN